MIWESKGANNGIHKQVLPQYPYECLEWTFLDSKISSRVNIHKLKKSPMGALFNMHSHMIA